jgi:hypothetical protein
VLFAWGNGGQYILMIPALKTVIAIVSGSEQNVANSRASRFRFFDFVENRLIGYLQKQASNSSELWGQVLGSTRIRSALSKQAHFEPCCRL